MLKGIFVTDTYRITYGDKVYEGSFNELLTHDDLPKFEGLHHDDASKAMVNFYVLLACMERYDEKGNWGAAIANSRERIFSNALNEMSKEELDTGFYKDKDTYKMDGDIIHLYDKDGKDKDTTGGYTKMIDGVLTRKLVLDSGVTMIITFGEFDVVRAKYKEIVAQKEKEQESQKDESDETPVNIDDSNDVSEEATKTPSIDSSTNDRQDAMITSATQTSINDQVKDILPEEKNTVHQDESKNEIWSNKTKYPGITIELDKEKYAPSDTIIITTHGVTEEMANNRAFIAVYKTDASHSNYGQYAYVEAGTNQTSLQIHNEDPGEYEIRLYSEGSRYDDTTFVTKAGFKIAELTEEEKKQKYKAIKIKLDKEVYSPNAKIVITTIGIPEEMVNDRAFFAIYEKGAPHHSYGEYRYPDAGTSKMSIDLYGAEPGDYEIRLYSEANRYDDMTLVTKTSYKVAK